MDEIDIRIELNNLNDEIIAIKEKQMRIAEKLYEFEDELSNKSNSMVYSDSFLVRAFAIWGHYLVVQLILVIPIAVLINIIS